MSAFSHPYLLGGGAVLLLLGLWLWRWASRHDLKGLAMDAAWQVARSRGDLSTRTDLGDRFKEVAAEASHAGRAAKVAGLGARHLLAQVASIAGILGMLGGAGLIAAAFLWR